MKISNAKITKHHIVPTSRWGHKSEKLNIKKLRHSVHDWLHRIFNNLLPHEQIIHLLLNINTSALTTEFKNDIMEILKEQDSEYYYKNWILVPQNFEEKKEIIY